MASSTPSKTPRRVAVLACGSPGHLNPFNAVVHVLREQGHEVLHFNLLELRDVIERTGATFGHLYRGSLERDGKVIMEDPVPFFGRMFPDVPKGPLGFLAWLPQYSDALIEDVRSFEPDVLLYDAFLPEGPVVSHVLRVPSVCLITFGGLEAVSRAFRETGGNWAKLFAQVDICEARLTLEQRYGLDVFSAGAPGMYLSNTCNIVASIPEFVEGLSPRRAPDHEPLLVERLGGLSQKLVHVGACIAPDAVRLQAYARHRADGPAGEGARDIAALMAEDAEAARQKYHRAVHAGVSLEYLRWLRDERGRRIALFSLGTVLAERQWDTGPGESATAAAGGAPCGKALLQHLLVGLAEGLGGDPAVCVVAVVGYRADAMDCFAGPPAADAGPAAAEANAPLPVPANFLFRASVDQLALLRSGLIDCFVSHCGANSTIEAVVNAVPVVGVPCFGDQLFHAKTLEAWAAGVALLRPYESATRDVLAVAVRRLSGLGTPEDEGGVLDGVGPVDRPEAVGRLRELAARFQAAGGAGRAAKVVLGVCETFDYSECEWVQHQSQGWCVVA